MRIGRILLAALIGGLVMFVWGAVSHMVLPIGEMGVKPIPNESVVVAALKDNVNERGFYLFPGWDPADQSEAAMKAFNEKYAAGPRGIVVFDPTGGQAMSPRMLATEFVTNVIACFFVAIVLSCTTAGVLGRAVLALLIGLAASVSIDASYWNWYRFPDGVLEGSLIDQGAGWFLAGLAIAVVLAFGRKRAPVMDQPA